MRHGKSGRSADSLPEPTLLIGNLIRARRAIYSGRGTLSSVWSGFLGVRMAKTAVLIGRKNLRRGVRVEPIRSYPKQAPVGHRTGGPTPWNGQAARSASGTAVAGRQKGPATALVRPARVRGTEHRHRQEHGAGRRRRTEADGAEPARDARGNPPSPPLRRPGRPASGRLP